MLFVGFSPGFNIDFLSTDQEIGCEELLRNDVASVEWDVEPLVRFFHSKLISR